jgi:hypothetical protein
MSQSTFLLSLNICWIICIASILYKQFVSIMGLGTIPFVVVMVIERTRYSNGSYVDFYELSLSNAGRLTT